MRATLTVLSLLSISVWCRAQNAEQHPIDVALEQKHDGVWSPAESRTVFKAGDEIRFAFRATAPGFLYVLNVSPAGQYHWLYPAKDSGLDNRVAAGQRYLVPATAGSFVMPEKPGFETIYWVLSPKELRSVDMPARTRRLKPSTLLPRCSPEELQARGACTDKTAGLKPAGLSARDLSFENADRAIIYEFWVAHR